MVSDGTAPFGELLQRHRTVAGLTQEELAERARLSARAISDLERGVKSRPHLATVRQLAGALQLTAEEQDELYLAARSPRTPRPTNSQRANGQPAIHTFLIADIRGYTRFTVEHGDEAAARLVTRFGHLVEETVAARGGRVIERRGDEVLAVFPSARQALRAAVELQARLGEQADNVTAPGAGVGLDVGEAVPVEGGYRGTALNLAARLCGLAGPGEVLASEGVIHLARTVEGLEFSERGTVQLKGFVDPIEVIQVMAAPSAPTPRPDEEGAPPVAADGEVPRVTKQHLPIGGFLGSLPATRMVAREAELSRLLSAVETVTAGQGRLLLLAGEPGVGKTRLAQEATLAVHNRGFLVAAGRCYEPQQAVPYYPFLDALGIIYAAAPAALRNQAAQRWPQLTRLLPDQLGEAAALATERLEEQERLFRAVAAFVQAVAEVSPVALLLDDLHWADSASLQLLHHLARQTRANPILIIGTYRDVEVSPSHPLQATLRDLSREQLLERVLLKRLPEAGTAAFIAEIMGDLEAGREFSALVHRHTDGNPFFTQQVLQVLIEDGSVYRQDGRWRRRAIQEIEVPESVRSVIAQRVSRLRPEAQEVLQEASVLGPAFTFDDLLAVQLRLAEAPDLEDRVDATLTDAASLGLVRLTGNEMYVFDHALTQQTLYAVLSPRRRRRLHRAAAEALESLPQRSRERRVAELSWHCLQGDDAPKAIHYSLLAGDQAESVFAHGEAERHYGLALELAQEMGDLAREAEAREKLGVALRILGRCDEALDMLERAARIHHDAGTIENEGRVVAQLGIVYGLLGAAEPGIARLRPLAAVLEERGPTHSLALLYAGLIRLYNLAGRQDEQLEASRRLLELARGLQDERLLAEAEVHRGAALMHIGSYEQVLPLLERAIPRAESVGDLHTVCTALAFGSIAHYSLHRIDQAMAYHQRAVEVAERLGDPREVTQHAMETSYFTFLVGDWRQARAYAEKALTNALELDDLRMFIPPLHMLGELCVYTGAWEEASAYLQECLTVAEHLRLAENVREVQAILAEKDLLEGSPPAALARLQPLLTTPDWEADLTFLLPLADVHLAVGDVGSAEGAVGKVLADGTHRRLPLAQIDLLRLQGAIAARRAHWEEAQKHFGRAVELAREVTYPWAEARALYQSGVMGADRGEIELARAQLGAAAAIFNRLGAEPYRTRAEQLLGDLAMSRLLSPELTRLRPPR